MDTSAHLQIQSEHETVLSWYNTGLKLSEFLKRVMADQIKNIKEHGHFLQRAKTLKAPPPTAKNEKYIKVLANAYNLVATEMFAWGTEKIRNAEHMETKTLESVSNMQEERRKSRKQYQAEYTKLTQQFARICEDVNKKKTEYQKCLELYKLMRSRFEEHYVKSGRGGRKLDDVRDKYQKACRKLHQTHNDYVLLLCEANEFEKDYRTVLLPEFYEQQHILSYSFIQHFWEILKEFVHYSNLNVQGEESENIDKKMLEINTDLNGDDLSKRHVSLALEPVAFIFDETLVEDSAGKLLPNQLAVDNLTVEWLRTKLSQLETDIKDLQERLQNSTNDTPITNGLSNLEKIVGRPLLLKLENTRKENEYKSQERRLQKQADLIKSALNELGCEEVPSGCDLSLDNQTFISNSSEQVSLSVNKPLVNEEWFHGVLPREEVVRLLTNEGDFLVRETTRNDECQTVLSVCWGGHKHFIVQTTAEGHYRFEGPAFPSIRELILYQYNSGLPVTGRSGAILHKPIPRERWELNNDDVVLLEKIGRGNFGDVYKAQLKSTNQEVAVKTCRVTLPEEHKKKFLQEGRILKQYDHPNIVKLIGICVQKQPIMIVMELVPNGSLLTFLRKGSNTLNDGHLMKMCLDTAAGMRYLESKNCIHRDLAARNCLVGYNNTVKISDFGMSREEEEYIVSDGMKQIPIKWTAPEALNFGKYTSLCDVWSYGILCWEIFSRGGTPYSGMSNSKAREKIDAGYRMPAPDNTPDEMYRLMLRCWEYQAENRPNFEQIYTVVETLCAAYRVSL